MPIMWRCSCGKLLKAKDNFAGRQAPCPACNAVHTIPKGEKPPEPPEEIFDAELVEEPEDQILDALPVDESARQMPAGYAMEPENSDDEPERRDTSERGRPPLRRPRGHESSPPVGGPNAGSAVRRENCLG